MGMVGDVGDMGDVGGERVMAGAAWLVPAMGPEIGLLMGLPPELVLVTLCFLLLSGACCQGLGAMSGKGRKVWRAYPPSWFGESRYVWYTGLTKWCVLRKQFATLLVVPSEEKKRRRG